MKITPFDPVSFIGPGWSIESDTPLPENFSLDQVEIKTYLKEEESYIMGEEAIRRGKEQSIQLPASVLQYIIENPKEIPSSWEKFGKDGVIFFDGTILRNPYGDRCALYACTDGNGWRWNDRWLGGRRHQGNPSASLGKSLGTEHSEPNAPLELSPLESLSLRRTIALERIADSLEKLTKPKKGKK